MARPYCLSTLLAVAVAISTPALAQDDGPWGATEGNDTPSDGDSNGDTSTDEDPGADPDDDTGADPDDDTGEAPADDVAPAAGSSDTSNDPAPAEPPETDADRQPVVDADAPLAGGNVVSGQRIAAYGAGTGVRIRHGAVLFGNRGTNQTDLEVRYSVGKWGVQIGLPVVAHRLPRQPRTLALGNLQVDAWRQLGRDTGGRYTALGLELHGDIGAPAWTWLHDADDLWPGWGADLALQHRVAKGRITTISRVAVGVRSAQEYDPFPGTYPTFELALAGDVRLTDRLGLTGETSFAWWDPSPWDATGFVRVDLFEGVRLRGGVVVPLGVWAGATPAPETYQGVREVTALADASMAF